MPSCSLPSPYMAEDERQQERTPRIVATAGSGPEAEMSDALGLVPTQQTRPG